jgi:WD40 repeat protein
VSRSDDNQVLAAGYDKQVLLYRNPITETNACPKVFYGHSADVTKMMFTSGDNHLISVGGKD